MGLNTEQQAAVSYLEDPLLVLAGPGTGKTQLLSAKVAYILEHTDANPENILCITFTESGASNMRERLASMIGQAAGDVHIYTYHAFGAHILERYKNYAEHFDRRLDSVIDGVTQYKLIHEIQTHLPVTDILKTAEIDQLIDTIQNAKSAKLSADDLSKIAERNLDDSRSLSEQISPLLLSLVPRSKYQVALDSVYQLILQILSDFSSQEPIAGNIEPLANHLLRELSHIIDEESAKEKPSVSALTKWKTARFERDDAGNYRLKDHIANKKLSSLAEIMRKYDEKLQAEGLFDFADMIEEAIRVLREDEGFRLTLSELFQYILLDEFQDTNPSQFELIKLLTDYEQPNVMAVGDDDQAIFEFQGASASNLLEFQNYYSAHVVKLQKNYRSTGQILDFSHRIAEQIDDSFAKHHGVEKRLQSMQDEFARAAGKAPVGKISRHLFRAATDEYYWIAHQIAQLIESGEDPNTIAIIAPKHKYIAPILPYLKACNINIAYEKKSNLLDDPKLQEIITLAELIYDLAHESQPSHRLLQILAMPFLAVEPVVALQAVYRARSEHCSLLDYLLKSDDAKLQEIATWLAELTTLTFDTPLELWLDYLTGNAELPRSHLRSPYLTYYQNHSEPAELFEFYENLHTLRSTVINHTTNSKPRLDDFVNTIQDYQAAKAPIISSSPYQDADHAVQIMSAHKSKGLEFKYVFLIAVDEMAWGRAKGNNTTFSLPVNLLPIRHTGITDDERLRLLFVAITRAKQFLTMTSSLQNFAGKEVSLLGYLDEKYDVETNRQLSPYLPKDSQTIIEHFDETDLETRIETTRQGWISSYQVPSPELEQLLRQRLEHYRLSATDLTNFIDLIYAGPEQVYQQRLLHAPDEPLTMQLAYGNLIHSTFEQVTSQGLSDEAALQYFNDKALEVPLDPHSILELQAKGSHSLKIALSEFSAIIRDPGAKAELNLSPEHPTLGDVPLAGKIDHLKIDPELKTIEVYDFKTGNYHDSKWQSHPTLYKYALQLGFYKLLLNLSPTYRNYKVTAGHILFVSPDNEDKVYDKVLEYDEKSESELKRLINAVYHQITSLDFIKNPEINLPADKNHTIKDIRTFVEKLLELE